MHNAMISLIALCLKLVFMTLAAPLARTLARVCATGLILAVCLVTFPWPALARPAPEPLVLYAAASMKEALDAALGDYKRQQGEGGDEVLVSYAGTPALARQIEAGAPVDLLIAADQEWMTHLVQRGLVEAEAVRPLISNRLVIVRPAGKIEAFNTQQAASTSSLSAEALAAHFTEIAARGRFAMADPQSVPAGKYGKAALVALGLWPVVAPVLAPVDNVRAALALAARGEASGALVYHSDLMQEPRVALVALLPLTSHPPIIYPMAPVRGGKGDGARSLMDFLLGPQAQAHFLRRGFAALSEASTPDGRHR
jgi:molybdate transport system substrate-binding protein